MTEVVAALIWEGNRFLICQRPPHKARGLLWEFVGGKVEPGETRQQALIRECREELDIRVDVGEVFMELVHEYPDLTVKLILFHAVIAEGTPKMLEHQDIRWIRVSEIENYSFCPADRSILEKLTHTALLERLFLLGDARYQAFQCKLMPTVSPERVIGVRMPALRNLAKEVQGTPEAMAFLHDLPHRYYDEDNLHGALISEIKDFHRAIAALDAFLPYVDNWATCDMLHPRAFLRAGEGLLPHVRRWLAAEHTYTVRFGLGTLMRYFLDERFRPEYLQWAAEIRSEEYYINMMVAWFFATALAKQYSDAVSYLEGNLLAPWTHNKAIQKACESRRLSDSQKAYLRTLMRTGS